MTTAIVSFGTRATGACMAIGSSFNITRVAKTVESLAIPLFAMAALASLPTVSADPVVDCMNACDRIEFAPLKLLCYALCLFAK